MHPVRSIYRRIAIPVVTAVTSAGGNVAFLLMDPSAHTPDRIGAAAAGVAVTAISGVVNNRRNARIAEQERLAKERARSQGQSIPIPEPTDLDW
ncbi:MAG: hypothetical protein ACP5OR_06165 [Candidatus Dormibacteria bacterium]